jgi:uncharacterized protein involved in copper resistance
MKRLMGTMGALALLVAATAAFAAPEKADAKKMEKAPAAAAEAKKPDAHHMSRAPIIRSNAGFFYGNHYNVYTMHIAQPKHESK